jgi:orotate phosphoribosyltransferase
VEHEEPEVLQILREVGAVKSQDHFVGVSGRHFNTYVVKDILFARPTQASRIGEIFALRNQDLDIDVVAGPALGGIVLSQWTAFHLSRLKGKEIYAVFTEKTRDNDQTLGRGYGDLIAGRKALVLEDSVRTGGTILKVIGAVRAEGGEIAAVSVMLNVTPDVVTAATFGVPFRPLAEFSVPSYPAGECPLCQCGVPINTVFAHGKKFMESHPR